MPNPRGKIAYCTTCQNTAAIDCHCGGDLCICGAEELPCPTCQGGELLDHGGGFGDDDDD